MIKDRVIQYLGIPKAEIDRIERNAPNRYKRYQIPKATGGKRTIYQPPPETKALQYSLMSLYFEDMSVHDIAMAYQRGKSSPQRATALAHSEYEYSVRIDFKDFFYSIKPVDIFSNADFVNKDNKSDTKFLKNCCFVYDDKDWWLAMGAPSSPIISNIVLYNLDERMFRCSNKVDPNSVLTRYADDVVFSTNDEGGCFEFYDLCRSVIESHDSPCLSINETKTSFMSRGNRRVVAGLVITPDGRVSIGRDKKRKISAMVHQFSIGILDEEEIGRLQGYLSWILDVEPDLYDRFAVRYGAEVVRNALRGIVPEGTDA
mgnify:CR=1 FL=1